LSLKLHPDKSSEPDAEVKFRHLVSISDVLKDESKRKKYDEVLINGLPDWRSGMYYIRRARKLGLLEMSIIVTIVATFGHYLMMIAAFYEKEYAVVEHLNRKGKKLSKEEYDKLKLEGLATFGAKKPKLLTDNLIVKSVSATLNFVRSIPDRIRDAITDYKNKLEEQKSKEREEQRIKDQLLAPKPKRVRTKNAPELPEYDIDYSPLSQANSTQSKVTDEKLNEFSVKSGVWTDDDIRLLLKFSKKFPAGTTQRWERVAEAIGRTVDDVTKKAKSLKSGELKVSSEPVVEQRKTMAPQTDNGDISKRDFVNEKLSATDPATSWAQHEQSLFESALKQYPSKTLDRWDRIAEAVPGKSKVSNSHI